MRSVGNSVIESIWSNSVEIGRSPGWENLHFETPAGYIYHLLALQRDKNETIMASVCQLIANW